MNSVEAPKLDIEHDIRRVRRRIARACERAGRSPNEVTLVAVSKTVDPSAIGVAFKAGVNHFGENRVQEAHAKFVELKVLTPRPIWHMVGHLQTNKAKTAVELFDIIQSVDSVRLAESLSRQTTKKVRIYLQVNVADEATKRGFPVIEISKAIKEIEHLPNLKIEGLMTIAPLVNDPEEVRHLFRQLRELRDNEGLEHLSMGMTDDFEVAIEEGATVVRIGRALFRERGD